MLRPADFLLMGLAVVMAATAGTGCDNPPHEGRGKIQLVPGPIRLPPGTPGTASGSTIFLTPYPAPPLIHHANCFAGVENTGEIGIGSAAGYTWDYLAVVVLPVNLNLGANQLGAYRLRITVSHPAIVQIDTAGVTGSDPALSSSRCQDRGCPYYCVDYPDSYPPQFNRAQGFEGAPTVSGDASGIVVSAEDQAPLYPTTGRVNLLNVRFRVADALPPGGVSLNLEVQLLEDPLHFPLAYYSLSSGVIIEHYQLQ